MGRKSEGQCRTWGAIALAGLLSGCASLNTLHNEVSTFGSWSAERKPASYVFERLLSQQAEPEQQQLLEDAATLALQRAGFALAVEPGNAVYLMQLGARVISDDPWTHNDPLFWPGGFRYGYGGRHGHWSSGNLWGPGWGPGWGPYSGPRTFEREVVLLIRDRKTGQLLYEARASNNGMSAAIDTILPAMFEATMKNFPRVGPNPVDVPVPLSGR